MMALRTIAVGRAARANPDGYTLVARQKPMNLQNGLLP
jgi:hypothetical protein